MRVINYIVFLLFIIFLNSLLLNTKINRFSNIEKYEQAIPSTDVRQRKRLDKLDNNKSELSKNLINEEISQTMGFTSLLEYITGENKRKEENRKSIIATMKNNNPLNKFKRTSGLKCKNIQIDISDTISSNNGKEDLILKTCAKECHKNKECLSFDYKDRKCRLSTWCSEGTSEKNPGYSIYRDTSKPIPEITKFNIYPKKKMYGTCRRSKIGGYQSGSSLIKCADKCAKNKECLSFDLTGNNKDICTIYKKCHNMHMTNDKKSFSGVLINSSTYSKSNRNNSIKRTRPN